jgi:spermidine/putrescine transport system substrate-binding protein
MRTSVTRRPNRRQFLQQSALLAVAAPALAAFLDACSSGGQPNSAPPRRIASPQHPVTWDIAADNKPIADGLTPEKGATLQLYSYADYIAPDAIKSFEDRYSTKIHVTPFNSTDDALTTIRRGGVDYDLYFPGYYQLDPLVTGGLIRPLNHSYIANIKNLWPTFSNPFYDQQWRYTVPYTVYTTGIGWHTDQVSADIGALQNPYGALWDPAYNKKTAVIDEWHTAMAMVLLKSGITDVNTASVNDLKTVGDQLSALTEATSPQVTVTMYSDLPAGQIGLSQMWSGDIVNAVSYLPSGTGPEVLRYWFPSDGKGLVDNDLIVLLRGGKNPVLGHLFLNHMLETDVAKQNFQQIGYQPPQVSLDVDSIVAEGLVPSNLKNAIVRPDYLETGYRLLELDAANDAAWQTVWRSFRNGRR